MNRLLLMFLILLLTVIFSIPAYIPFLSLPAIASGAYERVCVLFNIGALQSQVADSQNHTSDDGLKTSVKLFQVNVWCMFYVCVCVCVCVCVFGFLAGGPDRVIHCKHSS